MNVVIKNLQVSSLTCIAGFVLWKTSTAHLVLVQITHLVHSLVIQNDETIFYPKIIFFRVFEAIEQLFIDFELEFVIVIYFFWLILLINIENVKRIQIIFLVRVKVWGDTSCILWIYCGFLSLTTSLAFPLFPNED